MIKGNKEKTLKKNIDLSKIPKHVAIIMDGNGRWAKKRFLPRTAGHREGVNRVKEIVEVSGDMGIKYLTIYAFSTENWNRPKDEVNYLMGLLIEFIKKELKTIIKNDVKINVLGDINRLSPILKKEIENTIELTKQNKKLVLNIALNYGGRDEIIRGIKMVFEDINNDRIDIEDINEESFKKYLYTKDQPDPDLLIRTSGEMRLSNFLIYQNAYTEFVFSDVYWPDFNTMEYYKCIKEYQNRNRRFGGL
ncbi:isoprenyl transferase [Clostridiisalibacter paucivorans]|uniref:isoprenyl transferase n=1 Tax=Clostridiisalibacter paucivorans TaxID=408753 RepID=UPI00047D9AB2|nr:isoprenyl transferase [Clostridiisalibacter paucivorans]